MNLVSSCVLSYKILNEFKENTKVFRFNSKKSFHVMKTIKPAHWLGLKYTLFTLPLVHGRQNQSYTCVFYPVNQCF